MNIANVLHRHAPGALAIRGAQGERTYGQLRGEVSATAATLRASGVGVGDVVAIAMPNSIAHIATYYGAITIGSVIASIDPHSTDKEIETRIELVRPRVIVVADELADRTVTIARRLADAPLVLASSDFTGHLQGVEHDVPVPRGVHDPAVILFTSGSSGAPKGVVLTHGNVAYASQAQGRAMCASPADAVLLSAPMNHCFGQNAVLNAAMRAGSSVALVDPRRIRYMLDDLAKFSVTAVPTVPSVLRLMLDLGADRSRLPRLRWAMTAAATLPKETSCTWRTRFGFEVHEGYGLTETSPCAMYNDHVNSSPGSLGTAFDGVDTRVVRDDGTEVAVGEVGELLIKGPNVMAGYFEDSESTTEVIKDGWLRTGDLVRVDNVGDYWLVGRSKNIIIVSGTTVFPAEIESVLLEHPDVVSAAVVGVPNDLTGEAIVAFVQVQPSASQARVLDELQSQSRRVLSAIKRPRLVRALDLLPTLTSGKHDLCRLRDIALSQS